MAYAGLSWSGEATVRDAGGRELGRAVLRLAPLFTPFDATAFPAVANGLSSGRVAVRLVPAAQLAGGPALHSFLGDPGRNTAVRLAVDFQPADGGGGGALCTELTRTLLTPSLQFVALVSCVAEGWEKFVFFVVSASGEEGVPRGVQLVGHVFTHGHETLNRHLQDRLAVMRNMPVPDLDRPPATPGGSVSPPRDYQDHGAMILGPVTPAVRSVEEAENLAQNEVNLRQDVTEGVPAQRNLQEGFVAPAIPSNIPHALGNQQNYRERAPSHQHQHYGRWEQMPPPMQQPNVQQAQQQQLVFPPTHQDQARPSLPFPHPGTPPGMQRWPTADNLMNFNSQMRIAAAHRQATRERQYAGFYQGRIQPNVAFQQAASLQAQQSIGFPHQGPNGQQPSQVRPQPPIPPNSYQPCQAGPAMPPPQQNQSTSDPFLRSLLGQGIQEQNVPSQQARWGSLPHQNLQAAPVQQQGRRQQAHNPVEGPQTVDRSLQAALKRGFKEIVSDVFERSPTIPRKFQALGEFVAFLLKKGVLPRINQTFLPMYQSLLGFFSRAPQSVSQLETVIQDFANILPSLINKLGKAASTSPANWSHEATDTLLKFVEIKRRTLAQTTTSQGTAPSGQGRLEGCGVQGALRGQAERGNEGEVEPPQDDEVQVLQEVSPEQARPRQEPTVNIQRLSQSAWQTMQAFQRTNVTPPSASPSTVTPSQSRDPPSMPVLDATEGLPEPAQPQPAADDDRQAQEILARKYRDAMSRTDGHVVIEAIQVAMDDIEDTPTAEEFVRELGDVGLTAAEQDTLRRAKIQDLKTWWNQFEKKVDGDEDAVAHPVTVPEQLGQSESSVVPAESLLPNAVWENLSEPIPDQLAPSVNDPAGGSVGPSSEPITTTPTLQTQGQAARASMPPVESSGSATAPSSPPHESQEQAPPGNVAPKPVPAGPRTTEFVYKYHDKLLVRAVAGSNPNRHHTYNVVVLQERGKEDHLFFLFTVFEIPRDLSPGEVVTVELLREAEWKVLLHCKPFRVLRVRNGEEFRDIFLNAQNTQVRSSIMSVAELRDLTRDFECASCTSYLLQRTLRSDPAEAGCSEQLLRDVVGAILTKKEDEVCYQFRRRYSLAFRRETNIGNDYSVVLTNHVAIFYPSGVKNSWNKDIDFLVNEISCGEENAIQIRKSYQKPDVWLKLYISATSGQDEFLNVICAKKLPERLNVRAVEAILQRNEAFFMKRREVPDFCERVLFQLLNGPAKRGRGNMTRNVIKRRVDFAAQAFIKIKGCGEKLEILLFYLQRYNELEMQETETFKVKEDDAEKRMKRLDLLVVPVGCPQVGFISAVPAVNDTLVFTGQTDLWSVRAESSPSHHFLSHLMEHGCTSNSSVDKESLRDGLVKKKPFLTRVSALNKLLHDVKNPKFQTDHFMYWASFFNKKKMREEHPQAAHGSREKITEEDLTKNLLVGNMKSYCVIHQFPTNDNEPACFLAPGKTHHPLQTSPALSSPASVQSGRSPASPLNASPRSQQQQKPDAMKKQAIAAAAAAAATDQILETAGKNQGATAAKEVHRTVDVQGKDVHSEPQKEQDEVKTSEIKSILKTAPTVAQAVPTPATASLTEIKERTKASLASTRSRSEVVKDTGRAKKKRRKKRKTNEPLAVPSSSEEEEEDKTSSKGAQDPLAKKVHDEPQPPLYSDISSTDDQLSEGEVSLSDPTGNRPTGHMDLSDVSDSPLAGTSSSKGKSAAETSMQISDISDEPLTDRERDVETARDQGAGTLSGTNVGLATQAEVDISVIPVVGTNKVVPPENRAPPQVAGPSSTNGPKRTQTLGQITLELDEGNQPEEPFEEFYDARPPERAPVKQPMPLKPVTQLLLSFATRKRCRVVIKKKEIDAAKEALEDYHASMGLQSLNTALQNNLLSSNNVEFPVKPLPPPLPLERSDWKTCKVCGAEFDTYRLFDEHRKRGHDQPMTEGNVFRPDAAVIAEEEERKTWKFNMSKAGEESEDDTELTDESSAEEDSTSVNSGSTMGLEDLDDDAERVPPKKRRVDDEEEDFLLDEIPPWDPAEDENESAGSDGKQKEANGVRNLQAELDKASSPEVNSGGDGEVDDIDKSLENNSILQQLEALTRTESSASEEPLLPPGLLGQVPSCITVSKVRPAPDGGEAAPQPPTASQAGDEKREALSVIDLGRVPVPPPPEQIHRVGFYCLECPALLTDVTARRHRHKFKYFCLPEEVGGNLWHRVQVDIWPRDRQEADRLALVANNLGNGDPNDRDADDCDDGGSPDGGDEPVGSDDEASDGGGGSDEAQDDDVSNTDDIRDDHDGRNVDGAGLGEGDERTADGDAASSHDKPASDDAASILINPESDGSIETEADIPTGDVTEPGSSREIEEPSDLVLNETCSPTASPPPENNPLPDVQARETAFDCLARALRIGSYKVWGLQTFRFSNLSLRFGAEKLPGGPKVPVEVAAEDVLSVQACFLHTNLSVFLELSPSACRHVRAILGMTAAAGPKAKWLDSSSDDEAVRWVVVFPRNASPAETKELRSALAALFGERMTVLESLETVNELMKATSKTALPPPNKRIFICKTCKAFKTMQPRILEEHYKKKHPDIQFSSEQVSKT